MAENLAVYWVAKKVVNWVVSLVALKVARKAERMVEPTVGKTVASMADLKAIQSVDLKADHWVAWKAVPMVDCLVDLTVVHWAA